MYEYHHVATSLFNLAGSCGSCTLNLNAIMQTKPAKGHWMILTRYHELRNVWIRTFFIWLCRLVMTSRAGSKSYWNILEPTWFGPILFIIAEYQHCPAAQQQSRCAVQTTTFLPIKILYVKVFIFNRFRSLESHGPKASTKWDSHAQCYKMIFLFSHYDLQNRGNSLSFLFINVQGCFLFKFFMWKCSFSIFWQSWRPCPWNIYEMTFTSGNATKWGAGFSQGMLTVKR